MKQTKLFQLQLILVPDTFESEVADFPTSAPVDEDFDLQPESTGEINLNETQTFKLNISE